jgi:putative tributyrin esterase
MRNIFGDPKKVVGSKNDLFTLSTQLAASKFRKIPLFVCCGTEDFLIQANRKFRKHLVDLGLNLTYEESPGIHEGDIGIE